MSAATPRPLALPPALAAHALVPSGRRCLRRVLGVFAGLDVVFAALLSLGYAQISSLPTGAALELALLITAPVVIACTALLAALTYAVHRALRQAGTSEAALRRADAAFRRFPRRIQVLELARWLGAFALVFAVERPAHWQAPVCFLITLAAGTLTMALPLLDACLAPATAELWRAMHARGIVVRARPLRLAGRLAYYSATVVTSTGSYFACFAFSSRLKLLSPDAMMTSFLVFSGSALFFALLCSVLLATTFTRPIREMSGVIAQISRDDRLAGIGRVPLHHGDEIGALAELTNAMIDQLERTATERASALRSLGALNQNLERRVEERTRQLAELQDLAVTSAHHAGMSEIATNVLHNVGNVLTSVNVSCDHLDAMFGSSRVAMLGRVTELVRQQGDRLADYLAHDPAGQRLPAYLGQLGALLVEEHGRAVAELANLRSKVGLINDVVSAQQQYARGSFLIERADVRAVVEDILDMQAASLRRHEVRVVRALDHVEPIEIQRAKLAHVLINLLKNASEAMADTPPDARVVTVEVGGGARPFIRVRDTGAGIAPDVLAKVFQHGFTTKPTGHGFGLHASANAMAEMGGSIAVTSDGAGRGAAFTLSFGPGRA
jgi:signal transduction histidine kinase